MDLSMTSIDDASTDVEAAALSVDRRTAIHEAGHALIYLRKGRALRYVTLRPRTPHTVGRCVVRPRRVSSWDVDYVASAGPVAEAEHRWLAEREEGTIWDDVMVAALLDGGCGDRDAMHSDMYIENTPLRDGLLGELREAWAGLDALADVLVLERTLTGGRCRQILLDTDVWVP